jgi:hypothetical protein
MHLAAPQRRLADLLLEVLEAKSESYKATVTFRARSMFTCPEH